MARKIAIANQKGGVGKSTTAINLSAALVELGKKVLVIDMDPQGNTTTGLGVEKSTMECTVYELILGNCSMEDCLLHLSPTEVDLLPSDVNLAGAELELLSLDNKEFRLRDEIAQLDAKYDFIVLDCPPSLSLLTINALTTADSVLVPIQCEFYALEGLAQLLHTVELVKERLNERLEIEGVVFTMFDSRTNLSAQVVENVRENLEHRVFDTIIPRNIRLAEAPSYGLPITLYDTKSAGAISYRLLAEEVAAKKKKRKKKK